MLKPQLRVGVQMHLQAMNSECIDPEFPGIRKGDLSQSDLHLMALMMQPFVVKGSLLEVPFSVSHV